MHPSATARVYQQVRAMGKASPSPSERPFMVDLDSVCLPDFSHSTCPSTLDLELHRGEGSDIGSSADSDSGHLDATESIVSHGSVSMTTEQTGLTTFDDNEDVHGGRFRDPKLGCDNHGRDLYDFHPHEESFNGLATMVSNILFDGQAMTDGKVVDAASGFTEAGADKSEQSVGPGRYHNLLGTSDETQGPGSVEATGAQPNNDPISKWVLASWPRPIQRANELGELRDPTIGNHLQGVEISSHGTKSVSTYGPSIAAIRKLLAAVTACSPSSMYEVRPAARFNTFEAETPPTEAHWKTSSSPSSAARQIRIHESPQGVIQRMMPLDRTILFDMDTKSFQREDVKANDIDRIIKAACVVAGLFEVRKLGITFAYAPGPGPKVFRIRYDPELSGTVAADAFFPSDPREDWQVRISPMAFHSWGTSGDHYFMIRTLAHEFMHILGFRHHNAGSNEVQVSSMHWPGTIDGNSHSIMYTSVHSKLWFSEEDIRAIQEFYSRPNKTLVRNRWVIRDVDPYHRRHVL